MTYEEAMALIIQGSLARRASWAKDSYLCRNAICLKDSLLPPDGNRDEALERVLLTVTFEDGDPEGWSYQNFFYFRSSPNELDKQATDWEVFKLT